MTERPVFVVEPEPAPEPDPAEKRMTILEHLEELRKVIIHSLIAWGIASVLGLVASFWIVKALTQPLKQFGYKPIVLSPVDNFTIYIKVGLLTGLVVALPVILNRVWWFVAPGLKPAERRFAKPLLISSICLFALGAAFAYAFMYIGIQMLVSFSRFTEITYVPELNAYLGVLIVLMVGVGITFEFPVALVLLALVGLVSSARLRGWRKGAYLLIFAVGYLLTPGVDPITPLPLIIPLLLLYEASILVIRRLGR